MGRPLSPGRPLRQRGGCLRVALGSVLLVMLAPAAALVRWWRRRRRGNDVKVWRREPERATLAGLELTVDAPLAREVEARTALIDALVRVAEELRRPDDVYHLVFRRPSEPEADLVAIGPQPQELAQRLSIVFSHRASQACTQLWLTLPRGVHLAEVVDPVAFDPEQSVAAADLMLTASPRWAMVSSFARTGPSVVYRVRLHMSPPEVDAVNPILARLSEVLSAR